MKKLESTITLKQVTAKDHEFLFHLLSERQSYENISHKKMPSFAQHSKFILSKPYSKWYIILKQNRKIGSIYLSKQNEIGLFLKKVEWDDIIGEKALKLVIDKNPKQRYLANINPKNKKMLNFYKKNCFKLIQHTYELNLKE